ncbi:hypothetical protein OROMI_024656 [Orobanche minor]
MSSVDVTASSRKRKFCCLAPLSTTPESFIAKLEAGEREMAMIKVVQQNEADEKTLSLPRTWNVATSFKRNKSISMINLGDKEKFHFVKFKPSTGDALFGYLYGGGMGDMFVGESLKEGDQLVLLMENSETIMYFVYPRDVALHVPYAESYDAFKERFVAERALGRGDADMLDDDLLQTYWKVCLGEGNVCVHPDKYRETRLKKITDAEIVAIIENCNKLFNLGADPQLWDLAELELAAESLRGIAAKGFVVSKILALANALIMYKGDILVKEAKVQELRASQRETAETATTLRIRYRDRCNQI